MSSARLQRAATQRGRARRPPDPTRAAAELELRRLGALNDRYLVDFNSWVSEQVLTLDEATQAVRPWPDKPHLRDMGVVLANEPLVAFPKSRQRMATWEVAMWCLWNARFWPHHLIQWHSKDEDASAAVVDRRMAWAEDHLVEPGLRRPYRAHRTTKGLIGRMTFRHPEGASHIWAMAGKEGKERSYTPSIVVLDESEFQERPAEVLRAILPLIDAGKHVQVIILSTSNGPLGELAMICESVGFVRFR